MSIYAGKRLKLRCPKCKGANFELSETYEEAILFTVQDGVMPEKATDHYPGAIIGMGATCNACGHSWTPRAKSIDDIVIDDDAAMSASKEGA